MPDIEIEFEDPPRSRTITVEVSDESSPPEAGLEGPQRVGLIDRSAALGARIAGVSAATFNESLAAVPLMGEAVLDQIEAMQRRPREVEVAMCFKISAKGTIKLVEASGEAHLQVTLRWDATLEEGTGR
ncbi:CU044_2847 family protein [Glycomyces sp. NPDC047010]|uniref:CU044_2847 family protein n=1 Tax=Glycomyces sp. NPDC047010 TaxID=3155023 RepID=UPI0033DB1604